MRWTVAKTYAGAMTGVYVARDAHGQDPTFVGAFAHDGELVVALVSTTPRPASIRDSDPLMAGAIATADGGGTVLRHVASGVTGVGPRWVYLEFGGLPDPPPSTLRVTFGRFGHAVHAELALCTAAG